MTVDQLIEALQEHSRKGRGAEPVVFDAKGYKGFVLVEFVDTVPNYRLPVVCNAVDADDLALTSAVEVA